MKRLAAFLLLALSASAAEPIVGKWHLDRQEVNGKKTDAEALVLQVTPSGDQLAFAFSLPVNNIYFVSMSYTLRLDGSDADVKNSQGQTIGTIKMTRAGTSQYKLTIRGPNRPASDGTLTVSPDGKTLTSVSAKVTQSFSRY
jgi:hypothetical protein